jgi:hypothetical protein|tara:strand:- start:452 stop:1144 length:693 start_codon:yes stop_codon:yes gene_type:complete
MALTHKDTAAQTADYEERAAILEYDAGMPRADAERLARHWCLGELDGSSGTLSRPSTVTLTAAVKEQLLASAHGRNDQKTLAQTRRQSDAWTDLEVDYLGLKGEYVIAQLSGESFDETSYGAGGDDGVDIWIHGRPCAIKTNHRWGGYLLVERAHDLRAVSHILLVSGECDARDQQCVCRRLDDLSEERWHYAGWIQVPRFWDDATYANWGYGDRWWVPQSKLDTRRRPS